MKLVTKNKELNMLQPLLYSIFHSSARAGTSVSSDIDFIGSPYNQNYVTKINDWLTAKGLALKPNQCNLPKVLGDIQSALNGISRDKPHSVLPLDISKAIQERLKAWGVGVVKQNDTLFNIATNDITYSWTVVHKKRNIVMSITLPKDSHSGVGECGIAAGECGIAGDVTVNKLLSEIDVFITQITPLCNLMDKQLFIPERLVFEGDVISLEEFINQIQADIKIKMEYVNEIKQCYISSREEIDPDPDSDMMGLEMERTSFNQTIEFIEGLQGLQVEKINYLYERLQRHGLKIQKFFPQIPVSEKIRQIRGVYNILSNKAPSWEEKFRGFEMNVSVAK